MTDEASSAPTPAQFWESRYGERDRIWSGRANAALVASVAALTPGRALDLGCGEGADSVWLALHGWHVTGLDISATALARAREHARDAGLGDERIELQQADLATWRPADTYDLVSACFLHSPVEFPRAAVLRAASTCVAPSGHMLIVGHAAPPPWSKHKRHNRDEFPTPARQIEELDLAPASWQTVFARKQARDATGPDGEHTTLEDNVVLIRRC
jgi:SAM-dependent methyltransferase